MFKKLFGQGSQHDGKGAANSQALTVNAIQKLGETEELLLKRQSLLEKKIAAELEKAKEYTRLKNKKAALMALRKKKMLETQLEQISNNILRLNEQQAMLEGNASTMEMVSAMHQGAKANKAAMAAMKITDVDKVLEDITEQADHMQTINDALGQPIGLAANLDEDELTAEMEELESEELDNQLLEPAPAPSGKARVRPQPAVAAPAQAQAQALPSVPHARPQPVAQKKTPEELELEALAAEMAQ